MYLIEVEFYSWADMSCIKAKYIDGLFAIFKVSENDFDQFIEESYSREDVKKLTVYINKDLAFLCYKEIV